jgi:hypothetical protein
MLRRTQLVTGFLALTLILVLAIAAPAQDEGETDPAGQTGSTEAPPVDPAVADEATTTETEVEVEKMSEERMGAYEEDLERLRESVLESKARLMQLYEQLKLGSVSLVGVSIVHTHEVGSTFKLESITYTLDGFEVYGAVNDDENSLEKMAATPVYEGSLLPGEHLLVVDMVFRGKGYGIFSYLNQYLFKVKSRYSFRASDGEVLKINVTSYDEGSFLTRLKDRLKVKFVKD